MLTAPIRSRQPYQDTASIPPPRIRGDGHSGPLQVVAEGQGQV